ncbi:MAG: HD domain-containing protein [Thermomicrobiales bacterium]
MTDQRAQRVEISDWPAWEARFVTFLASNHGAEDAAHDDMHVRRVVANARALAASEGADLAVVLPAAWLHDCVIVPKDGPERSMASRLAARAAGDFLRSVAYPDVHIPAIQHAIEAHSFSARIASRTLEAQIVQDADRLDALGAIGIARTLMLGGAMGKPLYDADEPFPITRIADDGENVLDHFFVKLLTLSETMQTRSGRDEATRRTEFMRHYLAQLAAEIGTPAPPNGE